MTDAAANAKAYYPNVAGIDATDGKVYFVSKKLQRLVILDLARRTYTFGSTISGASADEPDQVDRLVRDDKESVLYFCEDGGATLGVFGRDAKGRYYSILEGRTDGENDETTGLAWSPNAMN